MSTILDLTKHPEVNVLSIVQNSMRQIIHANIAYEQVGKNCYKIVKNRYGKVGICMTKRDLLKLIAIDLSMKNDWFD